MSSIPQLRLAMFALTVLAFAPAAARADGAPPPPRPLTQTYLENAQRSLKSALATVTKVDAAPYGGLVEKERAAAAKAVNDMAEALAYVAAHPEINPMKPGQQPPDSFPVEFTNPTTNLSLQETAQADLIRTPLRQALRTLVNAPNTYRGAPAILGDIGGYRAKLIQDILLAAEATKAVVEYAEGRGEVGPTVQAQLEAVQRALHTAQYQLGSLRFGPRISAPPDLAPVLEKLTLAQTDATEAVAYVKAHPETYPPPANPETAKTRAPTAGLSLSNPSQIAKYLVFATAQMNVALGRLIDSPTADSHRSAMGDLGGRRKKIVDDINAVTAALRSLPGPSALTSPAPSVPPPSASISPPPPVVG